MFLEALLITLSTVLFIQMGLADAIQRTFGVRLRLCVKCLTFWIALIYFLITKHTLLLSVATSFICSYSSLWLAMLYDFLAIKYNKFYEQVAEESDPVSDEAGSDKDEM